ncbi:class I adenylate-forming enzyme family protein [Alicyclobacillus dauci]|uniref:AMP-binding protein n=1 Tax=Alicyclobacillus dauci TaxID=1475485 RepID=A0ABY6Z088_9BACL|nr:AMP-binding protein [Alicyclobacillus dauci]WAH36285.1 AMP-binding protein [Alicyclobacillus dauci]
MLPSGRLFEDTDKPNEDIMGSTLFNLLAEAQEKYPDKAAIAQVERKVRLTYRELYERVIRFAEGCTKLGLQKGDKIIACLPNWPEYVITLYAAARAGFVLVPVNPRFKRNEIEFILRSSGARAAITAVETDFARYQVFQDCQKGIPSLEHIICVSPMGLVDHNLLSFEDVIVLGMHADPEEACNTSSSDVAAIVYTSGTTGIPKGAILSHKSLLFSSSAMNVALENSERDVVLVVVPVCHIFGLSLCIMSVATKSTFVLMERFSPETVFEVVEREKVTVHHGVSTMFVLELNHPNRSKYDLSSLRTGIVAATPCPYEIVERIRSELGLNPILSYGMTETSPSLTASHFENEAWVYTTVGRVLSGVSLRVVDEWGNMLPNGEVGELLCKTPGLMMGYYENEEATRRAIDQNGWFHTGDLARLNDDGYVTIVGRIKEMISRGGLKIYPKEVEELIYQHPAVQEAAVVGIPDPVLGERSCACITLKAGRSLTPNEIRLLCQEHLADYKVPDVIEIMDVLPLSGSGKIYKMELAKIMREKYPPVYHAK